MSSLVIGLLGGGGIATVIASVIAGLFSKRKLGAEATQIIQQAAAGVVVDLRKSLTDAQLAAAASQTSMLEAQRAEVRCRDEMARMKQAWREDREACRAAMELHLTFQQIALAKLAESRLTLDVPLPPPLPPLPEYLR